MLRVDYHPLSTFSQRVRIALLEKDIPAELVEVDLPGSAQFRPEYLSKNPYGRVPAIDEDGWVLYESTADPRERARVAMHMKWCDLEFSGPAA
jgi:glutathione S-transferase